MSELATLEYSLDELRHVVAALDDAEMDTVSNCAPWTVRQLASHALNNQLLWAGMVTGEELVSAEDTMGAVAYDGDLAAYADDVARRALALWRDRRRADAIHVTPLGELPGSVVINFPTIDALAHVVGHLRERRTRDRVRTRGDPADLGGRGRHVHRRSPGSRADPARDRSTGRRHRHRALDDAGRPDDPALSP